MWTLEGSFTAHVLWVRPLGVGIFIIGSHLYLHLGHSTDGASRIAKGRRRRAGNLQVECNTTRKANKLELGIYLRQEVVVKAIKINIISLLFISL